MIPLIYKIYLLLLINSPLIGNKFSPVRILQINEFPVIWLVSNWAVNRFCVVLNFVSLLHSIGRSTSRHCWQCVVMPAGRCARWSLGLWVRTKCPTLVSHSPSSKTSPCPPWRWQQWLPWPPWQLQSCSNKTNKHASISGLTTVGHNNTSTFLFVHPVTVIPIKHNLLFCVGPFLSVLIPCQFQQRNKIVHVKTDLHDSLLEFKASQEVAPHFCFSSSLSSLLYWYHSGSI